MKPLFSISALFALIAFTASCGPHKRSEEEKMEMQRQIALSDSMRRADSIAEAAPPVEMNFSNVLDKGNDKKRIIIEGYVTLPNTSMISKDNVQLYLFERENQFASQFTFIINVAVGKGNNTMKKIPLKYTADDVAIKGNSGEAITVGDHVRITGKVTVYDDFCSVTCEKIEKIDPVTLDYSKLGAEQLTKENMDDPSLENKLVYAEGMVETPMMTMDGEYTFLYLNVSGMSEHLTIDAAYGDTPGRLEPLPKKYTDADFHLLDDNSKPVNLKRKVRVYGIWKSKTIKVESINNI